MSYNTFWIHSRSAYHFLVLLLTCSTMSFSQSNHIPLKGKSFLGALELMPNGKLAQGSYRVKSPFPGELDPMLDPYKWYGEGDEQVCGMVGDAVLYLEWWIKGSEPLERYKFDWTSSGHFVVKYKNDKGELVNKRINWYDLSKYPNLVKRFELIQPYKIGFEFTFHSGNKSSEDYYGFRKRYNIMEDLGSAGYAVDYTRKIPTWKVVHVRGKEKKNWGNPAILLGSWKEFCPLADKHKDKESRLLELFRMGRTIVISYKITEMHWRVSDFVYIAKKFAAYESGKEKPSAFDEVEDGKKEEKAGDESWDGTDMVDTEMEPYQEGRFYGLKSKKGTKKLPAIYNEILPSTKEGVFLAKKENGVVAVNASGKEIASLKGDYIISKYFPGFVQGEFEEREPLTQYTYTSGSSYYHLITISKRYEFVNNQFVFRNNYVNGSIHINSYTTAKGDVYQVPNGKYYIDKAERDKIKEKFNELQGTYLSQGYLKY